MLRRRGCLSGLASRLLPRPRCRQVSGVWNLSSDSGSLGAFFITNVRVVWYSAASEAFNISLPYLQVRDTKRDMRVVRPPWAPGASQRDSYLRACVVECAACGRRQPLGHGQSTALPLLSRRRARTPTVNPRALNRSSRRACASASLARASSLRPARMPVPTCWVSGACTRRGWWGRPLPPRLSTELCTRRLLQACVTARWGAPTGASDAVSPPPRPRPRPKSGCRGDPGLRPQGDQQPVAGAGPAAQLCARAHTAAAGAAGVGAAGAAGRRQFPMVGAFRPLPP
jgi:hypothetical protein